MPSETATQKPATGKIVARTLIAAVGAAIINNLYSVAYIAITGFSIPEVINFTTVTIFSVGPVILGGLAYWIASRFNVKVANIGLSIGTATCRRAPKHYLSGAGLWTNLAITYSFLNIKET